MFYYKNDNKQYAQFTNKEYNKIFKGEEITKEEYNALCPKEEPLQNVTIPENNTVESPVKETVEPVRYF